MSEEVYKSPEELGKAVGEKIEALFGGLFDEPAPQEAPAVKAAREVVTTQPPALTEPVQAPPKPAAAVKTAQPPAPAKTPAPQTKIPPIKSPSELLDRIEALALNLEWESKSDGIRELEQRFREIARFLPKEGPGRQIAGMNHRVLQLFGGPHTSPHPMLGKFLQESSSALRRIQDSQGRSLPDRELMTSIVGAYHQIMGDAGPRAPAPAPTPPAPVTPQPAAAAEGDWAASMGASLTSLQEVRRRLGNTIAAMMKQDGRFSPDDIIKSFRMAEHMLGEQIKKLSSLQVKGAGDGSPKAAAPPEDNQKEGLLLVDAQGTPIAAPASLIAAMYPLPKQQAEQLAGKSAIMLGNRQVPRLPLKSPQPKEGEAPLRPNWLIHLVLGEKEYFLLADRALGFRQSAKTEDISGATQVKFGATVYFLLTKALFR